MGFTALAASDIGPGKPVPYTMIENVRNNLDYLYGSLSGDIYTGGLVRNGGMEIDANADGQPDDWTINTYTGGGSTLITTATTWAAPIHGGKSLCITRPAGVGNGGAYFLSDYFPVSSDALQLDFLLVCNTTGLCNNAGVVLYDKDRIALGIIQPYATTVSNTAIQRIVCVIHNGYASACYGRVQIGIGATVQGSSGYALIDDVHVEYITPKAYRTHITPATVVSGLLDASVLSTFTAVLPYSKVPMVCRCMLKAAAMTTFATHISLRLGDDATHYGPQSYLSTFDSSAGATDTVCVSIDMLTTGGPQTMHLLKEPGAPVTVSYSSKMTVAILAADI